MGDENQLIQEKERAFKARSIIESDFFMEALDTVKEHFLIQMMNSQSGETEFRDLCWRSNKAADLFYQVFTSAMETGEFAEKQLEEIRRNKDSVIGGNLDPYGAIV